MNLQNKKRLTALGNELMGASREQWRDGIIRGVGTGMYTLLYLK